MSIDLVGDSKQCLFGFRGACPILLDRFNIFRPDNTKFLSLKSNYRSSSFLVHASNALGFRFEPYLKNIEPAVPKAKDSEPPVFRMFGFSDTHSEMNKVSLMVRELILSGIYPKDIAILSRTNRSLTDVEASMVSRRLPYKMKFDNRSVLNQSAFKIMVSLYALLLNPKDYLALGTFVSSFSGIGDKFVIQMEQAISKRDREVFKEITSLYDYIDILENTTLFSTRQKTQTTFIVDLLKELVFPLVEILALTKTVIQPTVINNKIMALFSDKVGFKLIEGREALTSEKRFAIDTSFNIMQSSIRTLNNVFFQLVETENEIQYMSTRDQLYKLYETIITVESSKGEDDSSIVDGEQEKAKKEGQVTLSTIHAAKGLEWDYVFFVSCNSLGLFTKDQEFEDLCAFYVAVTRPRKRLIMTYSEKMLTYANVLRQANTNPYMLEYVTQAKRIAEKKAKEQEEACS